MIYKQNFRFLFVWPQHSFTLCLSAFKMSFGSDRTAANLDHAHMWLLLCICANMCGALICNVDGTVNCVHRQSCLKVLAVISMTESCLFSKQWCLRARRSQQCFLHAETSADSLGDNMYCKSWKMPNLCSSLHLRDSALRVHFIPNHCFILTCCW